MLEVANAGFVDAMSIGILLSAAVMVVPIAIAALFLPGRTRTAADSLSDITGEAE